MRVKVNPKVRDLICAFPFLNAIYVKVRARYYEHLFNAKCRHLRRYGYTAISLIHEVLVRANLPYFADWGTLLGIVREHSFISHDDDLDFQVPPCHPDPVNYMREILTIKGMTFKRAFEWKGRINQLVFDYKGIDVDFFFMYEEGNVVFSQAYTRHPYVHYAEANAWTPHRFVCPKPLNIKSIAFHHAEVNIPTNFDEILTAEYGRWSIPLRGFHGNEGDHVKVDQEFLNDAKRGMVPREEPEEVGYVVGGQRVLELSEEG